MNFIAALFTVMLSLLPNTVHTFQGFHRNVLNLPNVTEFRVTSQTNSLASLAWTRDDVIKTPLVALTMCVWVKSTSLRRTGTIMSYTVGNKHEFSLLSYSSGGHDSYDVYLVVSGQRITDPIPLRIDDVVWHYVCVTWETEGEYRVYMDGSVIQEGSGLAFAKEVQPNGRFYFGAPHKVNETGRNITPFIGKLTGLSLWNTTLTLEEIVEAGDCRAFNEQQLLGGRFEYTNQPIESQLRSALVYYWSPDTMVTSWPASFYPNEDVCGGEVTVDCGHRHMLISLSSARPASHDISRTELHLKDVTCTPTARGRRGDHYVFELNDFTSCGTTRTVSDKEVVYTNHVSNLNTEANVVFVGYSYKSQVQCHYPIDLTVTMRSLATGAKEGLVANAAMLNPTTNEIDLEATVAVFKDGAFSKTFENTPLLRPRDSVYIGVVVKNTESGQTTVGDANVVVDSCWVTSLRHRRNIISNNGCTALYNGVTVLDNGRNSQARIKLSSEVFSFSSGPIYLQCSVYPCIGRDCSPDCTAQNNSESPPVWSIQNVTSAILPERQKRAVGDTVRQYDLTVGPVYAKDFWTHTLARPSPGSASINAAEDTFYKNPVFLATLAALSLIALFSLLIAIALLRKRRRPASENMDVDDPVEITQHKRCQSIEGSASSISTDLSISMSSFDSFSSFDSIEFSASHH